MSMMSLFYFCIKGLREITTVVHRHFKPVMRNRGFITTCVNLQHASCMETESSRSVMLTVTPAEVLVDEKVVVNVSGLKAKQSITIKSQIRDGNVAFSGCGCFEAGEDGQVDVTKQESLSGTYTGIDSMGLFWSLKQSPGQNAGQRLAKKDVTTPQLVDITVYNGHLSFENVHDASLTSLAKTQLKRWYKAEGVKRIPVKEGQIRGTLFVPPGEGPFPGVIDIFGTAGGLIEFRASLLASRGYTVLALAFFGYDDLPPHYMDLSLDYFMEAVEFVSNHSSVRSGGIGIIGVSKGGELAQLMAMHCSEVKAVVSINGYPTLTQFPMRYGDGVLETTKPLNEETLKKMVYSKEGLIIRWVNDPRHYMESDFFKLWERSCKMLSLSGTDDQCADYQLQQLQYDQYPDDQKHKIQLVIYSGAGHLIEPPYSPLIRVTYHKLVKMNTLNGGSPKEHADAQEDAWKRMQQFLKDNLPNKPNTKSKL